MTQPENEIQDVLDQLSVLAPPAAEAPSRPRAFAQLQANAGMRHQPSQITTRSHTIMNRRTIFATGFTAVLILAVLFSFPTVRAAASDFLGLFRVQKFAPISVSPEQLAMLEQLAEEGMAPGEMEVIQEPGAARSVDSLVEAEIETGMTVRTLAELGQPATINVIDGGEGRLRIDLAAARALMEAAGADPTLLPDSLDGAVVHVTVFPGVQQSWPSMGEEYTLMQAPSPWVEYPENVDAQALGEAVLQVLGTEPRQAHRIAGNIDWASTLLLPIPRELVTFREVTIDGVSGVALEPLDGEGSALLWQRDGILYMLSAPGNTDELLAVVDSLQ